MYALQPTLFNNFANSNSQRTRSLKSTRLGYLVSCGSVVNGRELVHRRTDDERHRVVLGRQRDSMTSGHGLQPAVGNNGVSADDHLVANKL